MERIGVKETTIGYRYTEREEEAQNTYPCLLHDSSRDISNQKYIYKLKINLIFPDPPFRVN